MVIIQEQPADGEAFFVLTEILTMQMKSSQDVAINPPFITPEWEAIFFQYQMTT